MVAMADSMPALCCRNSNRHRSTDRLERHPSEYANIAYWGIAALLMIRLIMQLAGIIHLACRCRKIQIGNTKYTSASQSGRRPFSFFHWILSIRPAYKEEFNEILTMSRHARQWHSIDVIISELVCIFCWFNPLPGFMKREIAPIWNIWHDARVIGKRL